MQEPPQAQHLNFPVLFTILQTVSAWLKKIFPSAVIFLFPLFVRLLRSNPEFESEEHEKAWLIRTAQNVCKNDLARARRRDVPLENAADAAHSAPEIDETLAALRTLPEQYRIALYLHYYEGYSAVELAGLLRRPASSIRSDLRRGRERLRALLGGEF